MADPAKQDYRSWEHGRGENQRMGSDESKDDLLREIKELENEIKDIEKSIPPHSVRYEMIQLLEEKEGELKRKKDLLRSINDVEKRQRESGE